MHRRTHWMARPITLIEILIVMALIAMISGVVAYSFRGTLNTGRAFTSEQHFHKIRQILELDQAFRHNQHLDDVVKHWRATLRRSSLVRDADNLATDGWGGPIKVDIVDANGTRELYIHSDAYDAFRLAHPEYKPSKTQKN